MSKILINGIETQHVDVRDRALQFGDGLFATLLYHQGDLYYWTQHYRRLQDSARRLQLACPPPAALLEDIRRLIASSEDSGAIKIILTRGSSERGYAFSKDAPARRILQLAPLPAGYSSLLTARLKTGRLYPCSTQVSINASLAGIKHLNRLENVLAANEFDEDYLDGLMLNALGHVIEGSRSNLFAVAGGEVFTPRLNLSGVEGVMRARIIAVCEKLDLRVHCQDMKYDEIEAMQALFISNSLIGMAGVTALAGKTYSHSDITQRIFEALLEDARECCHRV